MQPTNKNHAPSIINRSESHDMDVAAGKQTHRVKNKQVEERERVYDGHHLEVHGMSCCVRASTSSKSTSGSSGPPCDFKADNYDESVPEIESRGRDDRGHGGEHQGVDVVDDIRRRR